MKTTRHFGIYGLWRNKGKLVLVRKARGPYTGLLDLPGGTPEPGETSEETLARELLEETGVNLLSVRGWHSFTIHLDSDSGGRPIDFHHEGWIAEVEVGGAISHNIVEEDVAGIVLADNLSGEQLSPLAHEALRLYPPYIAGTIRTL